MTKIVKSTTIRTPVSRAFDYMADPNNMPEIWPSMHKVENVQMRGDGGHAYDWTYRMAGIPFHGHAETTEIEPNRLRVVRNESGIPSTFRWIFEDQGAETKLTVEVDYEIPGKVMERLAEPFVRRVNEREAETVLENLKARLETEERPRPAAQPTEIRP